MAGILTHVGTNEDLSGDACDFDHVKWIGKDHKYPINPSAALRAYKEAVYEIPTHYQKELIPPTLDVLDFISLELPTTIATLIDYSAKNCFLKRNQPKISNASPNAICRVALLSMMQSFILAKQF